MLRSLYDWTMRLAAHRHAPAWLFIIAFIESSVFPIPPEALMIPMVLARRDRAWLVFGLATVGSVLGGLAGYAIGYYLFQAVGEPILSFYGYMDRFAAWQIRYNEWGAWIVAAGGFTPIPYKVITIASGVMETELFVFMLASLLSRGGRFFLECILLWYFGPPIRRFVEGHLPLLAFLSFVLLIGGFAVLKFI